MPCTVGYFFVNNVTNAGNSYCALAHMSSLVGCILESKKRSSLIIVKQGIDIEINLALPFFVRSVYRVRRMCQGPLILNDLSPSTHGFIISSWHSSGITDDVAIWVSYRTSLIVLVCSWVSHNVAI